MRQSPGRPGLQTEHTSPWGRQRLQPSAHTPPAGLEPEVQAARGVASPYRLDRRRAGSAASFSAVWSSNAPSVSPDGTHASLITHHTSPQGPTLAREGSSQVRGPEAPPNRAPTWVVGENQFKALSLPPLSSPVPNELSRDSPPRPCHVSGAQLSAQIKGRCPETEMCVPLGVSAGPGDVDLVGVLMLPSCLSV